MKKIIIIAGVFLNSLIPNELYKLISIPNISPGLIEEMQIIGIDIDHYTYDDSNKSIEFAVPASHLNRLEANNIAYSVVHEDLEAFYQSRLSQGPYPRDFDYGSMGGYYTFEEIEEHIDEICALNPDIVSTKVSIGTTLEGRNIWALKISDNPNNDEPEPEVLYTGLHHSREPMSYMNLFYFMYWIVDNYPQDPLAKHIVDNREMWFVPAINPDGLVYNQSIAPNGGGMQRKNMRQTCSFGTPDGVDLNRNYSYYWGYDNEGSSNDGCNETYRGPSQFSEPESQAVRDFVESRNFKIALNYHSYSNLLIYPFGYTYNNVVPDDDLDIFIEYGQDMVQYNGYELGTGPELLYTVNGEACDWMYGDQGIFAYTPEIGSGSDGFWPPTSRIVPLAEENLYPNQFLALSAGPKYSLQASVASGPYTFGNSYPIYISVKNTGLSESNGDLIVSISSSGMVEFSENTLALNGLSSREFVDLGDLIEFQLSSNSYSGFTETIVISVYDADGYIYSESFDIVLGQTEIVSSFNFEIENSGWTVGALDDTADAGIWEIAAPVATYFESNQAQPGEDHSEDGDLCYMTGSAIGGSVGFDDVDNGKTTLFSPVFDLSGNNEVLVSYWKWYTNDVGDNPNNDYWKVDVTNDGQNWYPLENTNESSPEWIKKQFLLASQGIAITSQMQFRFIAEDELYPGDSGSGGSIVEAAIDDFTIEVFESVDNPSLGDINSDGSIDILDVVMVVNFVLGVNEPSSSQFFAADINGDSIINILDIVAVVGLII